MESSVCVVFFKQKTAYEMRISDWSSVVCSSDLLGAERRARAVHLFPRVGPVELDVLDIAAEADVDLALAALLQALQDRVLDLHVPGEVVLAGLQHRSEARRVGKACVSTC